MISGKTSVYGLIGDPVDHSMSPAIQNAALRSQGIDAVYVTFHVTRQSLSNAIRGLRALEVRGFNVTAPHKVKVLRYLDRVDKSAAEIGSVNTVANNSGEFIGYNTDGQGAINALGEAGETADGKSILIFGAGGASRAVAYTLAQRARSIRLANRTLANARELANRLRKKFAIDVEYTSVSSKLVRAFVEDSDIVINASSMGMEGRANPPVEADWLRSDQCVFDVVYVPPQTRLLELAGLAGARRITGLDMLVNQGACSFELWTGRKAPILEMRRAIAEKLVAVERAESS